jgi:hypothetical protein
MVIRVPEIGKGKRLIQSGFIVTPRLAQRLDTNYTSTFISPFTIWIYNHALIDFSVENIETTVSLLDKNDYPIPNFEITGETGQLHFNASTNTTIDKNFRGMFNFTLGSLRKDFSTRIFTKCLSGPKVMKAAYKARLSIHYLSMMGIYPVIHGTFLIDCPDFASGLVSGNSEIEQPLNPSRIPLNALNSLTSSNRNQTGLLTRNGNAVGQIGKNFTQELLRRS